MLFYTRTGELYYIEMHKYDTFNRWEIWHGNMIAEVHEC